MVGRCTSKSMSTRKPTRMSDLSTNLISACLMHLQMSGIYAKIETLETRMVMILIPTMIIMIKTIQKNLFSSQHPLLHQAAPWMKKILLQPHVSSRCSWNTLPSLQLLLDLTINDKKKYLVNLNCCFCSFICFLYI